MADFVPCDGRANSSGDCLLTIIKSPKTKRTQEHVHAIVPDKIRLLCAFGSGIFVSAYSYCLIILQTLPLNALRVEYLF